MTDKDSNDMTASEMLRWSANYTMYYRWGNPWNKLAIAILGLDPEKARAQEVHITDAFSRLADKIDAELAQARDLSLRRGAELWAKANGWPDFKDGEDFGQWLDRCALPRLRFEDGEPVQFCEEIELHYKSGGCDKGRFQEIKYNKGPVWILSFTGVDHALEYRYDSECDTIKRPAPEVLGADGLPIKVGDAMWSLSGAGPLTVTSLHTDDPTPDGGDSPWADLDDDGLYSWIYAGSLTHTTPDTLERLRDDIAEWRAECANPGSGWDAKTAEWADRIDAIIRRTGGAE